MGAVLAIDQGTTGSTCMVIDGSGQVLGRAYSEFTQHYPRPGRVEHDAEELWQVTLHVAREAIADAGVGVTDGDDGANERLVAIGIANQRESIVLWDRESGEPVHRAIVWQDRRTEPLCRELREAGREDWIRERTGLLLDPYFSATKLTWLFENNPELLRRAEAGELAAGTIDSWLLWRLTGGEVHATEPTNACRTLLYDIDTLEWNDELLSTFGVPRAVLPEVLPSSGVFGHTDPALFGGSIPIAGAAGDQQAAMYGQGCWTVGRAKNTLGTGAFLLLYTGEERVASDRGLLTTVTCGSRGEPRYALEGAILVAGAAVQWLRDELGIIATAAETAELAASIDSNDEVYFVPAFAGLGAPHWEADARGTIVGLTRGSGRAHLARAALEAMAYSTHDVLAAMTADSGEEAPHMTIDGGAAENDWLAAFLAGILDRPVLRPENIQTTALGAAGLAGVAVGLWEDGEAFLGVRPDPMRFEPDMEDAERERLLEGWQRAVDAASAWGNAG